jgi:solute:Na+ symporter, SSS family
VPSIFLALPPGFSLNEAAPIMNTYFNLSDWFVILFYLAGIIGLGVWFGRDQRNTRDYFLGSRNIPWWGIGLSIVAAETSALTIIGVPAMAFGGDIAFLQMVIGYVIARIILAVVIVPHYFKGEIYSPYQLFADKFGAAGRRTAGGMFLISETLAAGVRVYVASIPVKLMLGDKVLSLGTGDPIFGAIFLFVALSLVYTYIGGVKAVIWTDAVQFGLFLLGGLFVLCYIPTLVGGAFSQAAAGGKLHWLNVIPPEGVPWKQFLLGSPFNLWMGVIGGTVMVMSTHGAEQLIVQRVLACRNVADGRKALVLSAVFVLPLFLIFLLVGALLWAFYQGHPFQIPLPEVKKGSGIGANDFIFPIFIMTEVPHVLKGFLIVAILSAAMSSVSSALTSLASVSTMDFVRHGLRGRSEEFYLRFSKYSTVFWAVALVLVAYLSREAKFVLNWAFSLRGLTGGALLGGLLLAVLWKKGRGTPLVAGMLTALVLMSLVQTLPKWDATKDFWMRWVGTEIFWPWYTLIGASVTLLVAWVLDRLLPKTKVDAPGA